MEQYRRIYIAGAGGMLGSYVKSSFETAGVETLCSDIDTNESWLEYGDEIWRSVKQSTVDASVPTPLVQ